MDYSLLVGVKKERFHVLNCFSDAEVQSRDKGLAGFVTAYSDYSSSSGSKTQGEWGSPSAHGALSLPPSEGPVHGRPSVFTSSAPSIHFSDGLISHRLDTFGRNADGGMQVMVVEGPGLYYFGIIDILQEWNFKKQLERFYKVYILGQDGNGISAMRPNEYSERFWQRCVLDTFDGLSDEDCRSTLTQSMSPGEGSIMIFSFRPTSS
jgi:1-phosphatidylinositol-4-phosphate 5-kinase